MERVRREGVGGEKGKTSHEPFEASGVVSGITAIANSSILEKSSLLVLGDGLKLMCEKEELGVRLSSSSVCT